MSIRIGSQSSWAAANALEPFEYAVAQGFDAFEWFPDKKNSGAGWDEDDLDRTTRDEIKAAASSHDVRLSVHAPLHWNPLDEERELIFEKDIQLAQDIGARLINIHLVRDKGLKLFLSAVVPIARVLMQKGIMLVIENTPSTPPDDFNALFSMIADLNRSDRSIRTGIGMCLDLGHANLCDQTRNDYLRYIDLLEPHVPIAHIHLHENFGDYDSHLPVFTGPAARNSAGIKGFVKRMKVRRFSGTIILEQWPEPRSLLNDARDRLLEMWDETKTTIRETETGIETI